ncbi:hypothetical protein SAMN05216553_12630 [Lentzea fradiae]|uniref:Uncharacterized protein n=1 Tax=Lentzea fradiae TaxID=200378 RepID=A0A1G8D6I9_9PSEU|nr:hypothetical protein [Lentzea fradiae]SDH52870.1 hypothetical protein SAMN05216553_12630 [Lentzea fradiae]
MDDDVEVVKTASPQDLARNGYAHPAEVAGRSMGEMLHLLALLITAAADVAVFYAIASIVMQDSSELIIGMLVAGFTAGSLTLAHFVGRFARDTIAGYGPRTGRWILVVLVPWLLLGVVVFVVRMLVAESATSGGSGTGLSQDQTMIAGAVMFGGLYLVSGAVAAVGEFLTRNPYRTRYRTAFRANQRALKSLARTQHRYERAVGVLKVHTASLKREDQNYKSAKDLRTAWASKLKRYSAVLIAAHLQNPSATDGMTEPDRSPSPMPHRP